jgi:serine/threonine protein kinase
MSPEQAKGKSVDRRTDIWAFGCVLFEMLTGKHTFEGETVTDTLAAVIRAEPEWALLPSNTPNSIRNLLLRCLKKDPKQRLQSIGEARIVIDETISGVTQDSSAFPAATPTGRPLWQRAFPWAVAAGAVVAAIAFVAFQHPAAAPSEPLHASFNMPASTQLTTLDIAVALSPDGK